jgi:integration host factor subunit alpha
MAAIKKADLVENLFNTLGLNKRESKEIVEALFEEIILALENGEQVKLSGLGNFKLRDKRQRPGRNPKTGKEIPVSPRRVVTFRAGQKLRNRIEQYANSNSKQDATEEKE